MSDDKTQQEEETVKEAADPDSISPDDILCAFTVVKLKDGKVLVQRMDTVEPGSPEEMYAACNQVLRTLDAQTLTAAVHTAMLAAAEQVQAQDGKTKSGLVVPN